MAKKKPTFEQAISRLEEIVALMERTDTPLQQSVALYQEGITLAQHCEALLVEAQTVITTLAKTADGLFQETPFDVPESF